MVKDFDLRGLLCCHATPLTRQILLWFAILATPVPDSEMQICTAYLIRWGYFLGLKCIPCLGVRHPHFHCYLSCFLERWRAVLWKEHVLQLLLWLFPDDQHHEEWSWTPRDDGVSTANSQPQDAHVMYFEVFMQGWLQSALLASNRCPPVQFKDFITTVWHASG